MGFCLKILTNLSVPSVIFADASWYGSVRGGVTFGGGADTRFMDGGSRWGIKGSNELADGLSAIYQFEHKFSTEDAGMDGGGRLAHVGLSGGFGTLTLGQIWSASFNATGAITDNSLLWGDSATSYRVGNAVSYSNSVGNASLQIDAIMDSDRDTGDAVDQIEFGMTIGLGDIGKVAVGYVESKDTNVDDAWVHMPGTDATPGVAARPGSPAEYFLITAGADTPDTELQRITVMVPTNNLNPAPNATAWINPFFDADGDYQAGGEQAVLNRIGYTTAGERVVDARSPGDAMYQATMADLMAPMCGDDDENCREVEVFVRTNRVDGNGDPISSPAGGDFTKDANTLTIDAAAAPAGSARETYYIVVGDDDGAPGTGLIEMGDDENNFRMVDAVEEVLATPYMPGTPASVEEMGAPNIDPGYKATHIAVEFGLGGVTTWLGHSKTENNSGALVMPDMAPATGDVMRNADGELDRSDASDTKVTHAGVRGSVGDGGINYYVAYRSVDAAGAKSNPFLINLNQSLGDGATAFVEHANNDDGKSGKTWVGLRVNF